MGIGFSEAGESARRLDILSEGILSLQVCRSERSAEPQTLSLMR